MYVIIKSKKQIIIALTVFIGKTKDRIIPFLKTYIVSKIYKERRRYRRTFSDRKNIIFIANIIHFAILMGLISILFP